MVATGWIDSYMRAFLPHPTYTTLAYLRARTRRLLARAPHCAYAHLLRARHYAPSAAARCLPPAFHRRFQHTYRLHAPTCRARALHRAGAAITAFPAPSCTRWPPYRARHLPALLWYRHCAFHLSPAARACYCCCWFTTHHHTRALRFPLPAPPCLCAALFGAWRDSGTERDMLGWTETYLRTV